MKQFGIKNEFDALPDKAQDIKQLGILFFYLCLRRGEIENPQNMIFIEKEQFECSFIKKLTNPNPSERPDIDQILQDLKAWNE